MHIPNKDIWMIKRTWWCARWVTHYRTSYITLRLLVEYSIICGDTMFPIELVSIRCASLLYQFYIVESKIFISEQWALVEFLLLHFIEPELIELLIYILANYLLYLRWILPIIVQYVNSNVFIGSIIGYPQLLAPIEIIAYASVRGGFQEKYSRNSFHFIYISHINFFIPIPKYEWMVSMNWNYTDLRL